MITVYSTSEVANKVGLTDRSVRRRIQSGRIEAVKLQSTVNGRVTYGVTENSLKRYQSTKQR